MIMKRTDTLQSILIYCLLCTGMPIMFYQLAGLPQRTVLKETFSLMTLLAFFLMLGQFFLSRGTFHFFPGVRAATLITWHKILGYLCVAVLLIHPLLIVLPRHFEAGIGARSAFITMITTTETTGITIGIISWIALLTLGITSLLRKQLFGAYRTWRRVHGLLALILLLLSAFHAIDLGRHMTMPFAIYLGIGGVSGALLLVKTMLPKPKAPSVEEVTI